MSMVSSASAFTPPAPTHLSQQHQLPHFVRSHRIALFSANGDANDGGERDDYFDPFLQSPHSFGTDDDDDNDCEEGSDGKVSTFGFLSHVGDSVATVDNGAMDNTESVNDAAAAAIEFDPLLSPHAYANGVDAAPVDSKDDDAGAVTPTPTPSNDNDADDRLDLFDPLLSPHAYADGTYAGPAVGTEGGPAEIAATQKLGILLIDHGSKRRASNEHIHDVARMYENRLTVNNDATNDDEETTTTATTTTATSTIVRAAHMEICEPSIVNSLREMIAVDGATRVVCVPYFLSPGRHATEDVPALIADARRELEGEGLLGEEAACSEILVSDAIGTHLRSMLGAVDDLVEWTLSNEC